MKAKRLVTDFRKLFRSNHSCTHTLETITALYLKWIFWLNNSRVCLTSGTHENIACIVRSVYVHVNIRSLRVDINHPHVNNANYNPTNSWVSYIQQSQCNSSKYCSWFSSTVRNSSCSYVSLGRRLQMTESVQCSWSASNSTVATTN